MYSIDIPLTREAMPSIAIEAGEYLVSVKTKTLGQWLTAKNGKLVVP